MAEPSDLERELHTIANEMRKLEGEYNMYFAGRLPRPPVETRARLEALLKKWERAHVDSLALRFRLNTLQTRFSTFADLWDRGMRAREEGRPGPFGRRPAQVASARREDGVPDRIVHVASFSDPSRERDKLRELYDGLCEARRETGEGLVPYERFADLVSDQVRTLTRSASADVAFRVAVKDGRVSLTARTLKGAREDE
jgi:hypothetical protein